MKGPRLLATALFSAFAVLFSAGGVCASTSDAYYQVDEVPFATEATLADRLRPETADYKFDYGDDDSLAFDLPWTFKFYGQNYTRITADTNGNIWFGSATPAHSFSLPSTGPVISVWNNDLSSYYHGGVFIQHMTNPERVVVRWRTEAFVDAGYGRVNDFEAVLFADGAIRFDYVTSAPSAAGDFGSGISKGDGLSYLGISDNFGSVPSLAGLSFFFEADTTPPALAIDPATSPTNLSSQTLSGMREAGATVAVSADTAAAVGTVSYLTATSWSCSVSGLAEGANTFTVTATDIAGNAASADVSIILDIRVEATLNPLPALTNAAAQTLAGTRETEATVSVTADTAATIGPVAYPTATSWSCPVSDLAEGANTFTVTVTDTVGNVGSFSTAAILDTLPPTVSVAPVSSPTNVSSQMLSGTREAGATVSVAVDTAAVVGSVTYPSATTWSCPVSGLAEGGNAFTVTATDVAGNAAAVSTGITLDTVAGVAVNPLSSPTNVSSQTLSGTIEAGATVSVSADTAAVVGPVSYPTATTWSCPVSGSVEGANTFTITATDAAGNSAVTSTGIILDTVAQVAVAPVSSPSNVSSQTLSGTREAGATVSVSVDTTAVVEAVSYPTTTSWSCAVSALVEGANTFTITATDAAGNSSSASSVVIFDTIAPAIAVDPPSSPTNVRNQTLNGTRELEAIVALSVDTAAMVGPVTYPTATTWSCPMSALAEGTNTFTVTATDAAGNSAGTSSSITLDTIVQFTLNPVVSPTNVSAQLLTGTREAGATVEVISTSTFEYLPVTYPTPTTWSCEITGLAEGPNNFWISATDALSNMSSYLDIDIVLDTVAPTVAVDSVPSPTNVDSQTLSGTIEAGAIVTVSADTAAVVGPVTSPTATTWRCAVSALTEGANTFMVTATDTAGNEASLAAVIALDTVPPTVGIDAVATPANQPGQTLSGTMEVGATVVVTADTAVAIGAVSYPTAVTWSCAVTGLVEGANTITVTATDVAGNVNSVGVTMVHDTVVEVTVDSVITPTHEASQTLHGTMEVGAVIHVFDSYTSEYLLASYPTPTSWSREVTGLREGLNNFLIEVIDPAGNADYRDIDITLDTIAPTVTISPVASPINVDSQTLSGTMETGATVVVAADTAAVIGAVSYPTSGTWSCQVTGLVEGMNTFAVTATDAAGNGATAAAGILLDTVVDVTLGSIQSPTNASSQTIGGTREEGATVEVLLTSTFEYQTVIYPTPTTWSCEISGLMEGANNFWVMANDQVGNMALPLLDTDIVLDTVPPAVGIEAVATPTNQLGQTLSGTMEAGATVVVTANTAAVIGAVSYPMSGTWVCQVTGLVEGTNTFTVTAADAAGNQTMTIADITLDTEPPMMEIAPVSSPTNLDSIVLSGTMETGAIVTVINLPLFFAEVTYPTETTWQCTVEGLSEGINTIVVDAVDAVGNSAFVEFDVLLDTQAPAISVDTSTTPTNQPSQILSGTMEAGATVTVTADTVAAIGEVGYPTPTSWSCAVSGLVEGVNTLTVTVSDAAGNQASLTAVIALDTLPPAVDVDAVATPTNQPGQTLSGMMEAGATVVVTAADTAATVGAVSYPTARTWSCEVSGFVEGMNTFTVTATDAAGNGATAVAGILLDTVVDVTLGSIQSPTNASSQTIGGTREEGATVDVLLTSTFEYQTVIYPTPTTWSCEISGLMEGTNNFWVMANDQVGNMALPLLDADIVLDTQPPAVGINAVTTPTSQLGQTLSGAVESGATVSIMADTAAVIGPVSISGGAWSCPVSALAEGLNTFTVTATDAAGNQAVASCGIVYDPPLSVSISPTVIQSDFQGTVRLNIAHLAVSGDTILVEQVIDVNNNGSADAGEPVIRSFAVTDGAISANPNVQGDEDGTADRVVTTSLSYFNILDRYHAPADYVFRTSAGGVANAGVFTVDPVVQSQTIAGSVTSDSSPVPGAFVRLSDKWGRPVAYTISNSLGHYQFEVAVGEYMVIPEAFGHAAVKAALPLVSPVAGGTVTADLAVTSGVYHLSGQVYDSTSASGMGGVLVKAESVDYLGEGLTDAAGNYDMLLPAGAYKVDVVMNDGASPACKGYVANADQMLDVNLTGDLLGADFPLNQAAVLISGTVRDAFGFPVAGLPVQATVAASEPLAYAVADGNGNYTLGLSSGGGWTVSLDVDAVQSLGYLGDAIENFSTISGPLTGNDLTAHGVDAWVQGTVTNTSNAPLEGIVVKLRNGDGLVNASVATAADGTYRLGCYAAGWYVLAATEAMGYLPAAEQNVTPAFGQMATVDFVAEMDNPPPCGMPAGIYAPGSSASGTFQVYWDTSSTPGVTYVLEQSQDGGTYSAIYTGTNNYYNVSGLSNGSYSYRVKATKEGNADSAWKGSTAVAVML